MCGLKCISGSQSFSSYLVATKLNYSIDTASRFNFKRKIKVEIESRLYKNAIPGSSGGSYTRIHQEECMASAKSCLQPDGLCHMGLFVGESLPWSASVNEQDNNIMGGDIDRRNTHFCVKETASFNRGGGWRSH